MTCPARRGLCRQVTFKLFQSASRFTNLFIAHLS
jgi:hypothetical protein